MKKSKLKKVAAPRIYQDKKDKNILHIDGRRVNKLNFPAGFDFNLIFLGDNRDNQPLNNYDKDCNEVKIIDISKI